MSKKLAPLTVLDDAELEQVGGGFLQALLGLGNGMMPPQQQRRGFGLSGLLGGQAPHQALGLPSPPDPLKILGLA